MSPRFAIDPAEAAGPYVLALDVGSGGSRAALYDATGREVGHRHHKVPHRFTTGDDGTSTIDADQVVKVGRVEMVVPRVDGPLTLDLLLTADDVTSRNHYATVVAERS